MSLPRVRSHEDVLLILDFLRLIEKETPMLIFIANYTDEVSVIECTVK